jgi:hypothetical protein
MTSRNPAIASSFAVLLSLFGCSEPNRPPGVTPGAVRIDGAKTYYWQLCRTGQGVQIHCTVWNGDATILKDETYLPLDEGPTPKEADLAIRPAKICSGPYQVCLTNGRVLLPESQFEQLKNFMKRDR